MQKIAAQRCRCLIILITTFGLAMPALANRQATARVAGTKRATAAATSTTATTARALAATTPRLRTTKTRVSWQTTWQMEEELGGVILLKREVEPLAPGSAPAGKNVAFTGRTYRTIGQDGAKIYNKSESLDVGTLVFEPLPNGQHRVLLRLAADETLEVLPARKSAGATGRPGRLRSRREIQPNNTMGRLEVVQFFKATQKRTPTTYYAVYGEEDLEAADGSRQTLTHLIDLASRQVVSVPYNFISVWNGFPVDSSYVLVEPLKADGTPQIGKVLGIPIHLLKQDFTGTLADPSTWVLIVDKKPAGRR